MALTPSEVLYLHRTRLGISQREYVRHILHLKCVRTYRRHENDEVPVPAHYQLPRITELDVRPNERFALLRRRQKLAKTHLGELMRDAKLSQIGRMNRRDVADRIGHEETGQATPILLTAYWGDKAL